MTLNLAQYLVLNETWAAQCSENIFDCAASEHVEQNAGI
jgi:hypothetical protein